MPDVRSLRLWQTIFGTGAAVLVGLSAWRSWWPFNTTPAPLSEHKDPSLWQFLLSDRVTLGFLRAAIAGLVLYVAISIPALVAGGRWLRGFGTSGLTADDAKVVTDLEAKVVDLTNKLNEATEQADRLKEERNTLRSLVTSVLRRSHQTPTRRDVFPIVEEPGRQQDERGRTETDPEETGGG